VFEAWLPAWAGSLTLLSFFSQDAPKPQVAGRSAYDEVLYGSDSNASAGGSDEEGAPAAAAGGAKNRKAMQRKNKREEGAYIHEGDDEVLDLLDDRMMSKISGQFGASGFSFRAPSFR